MVRRPPDLPVDAQASPAEHRVRDPRAVHWYLPTWGERVRLMGWRNVAWLMPLAVLVGVGGIVRVHAPVYGLFGLWKLAIFLIGLPISIAVKHANAAVRDRVDAFCIHCGYSLTGLADGQPCPECGESTTQAMCREYQRDPQSFIDRFKSGRSMPTPDAPVDISRDAPLRGDGT